MLPSDREEVERRGMAEVVGACCSPLVTEEVEVEVAFDRVRRVCWLDCVGGRC